MKAHLDMVIMGIRNMRPYKYLPMQLPFCVFEVRTAGPCSSSCPGRRFANTRSSKNVVRVTTIEAN